MSHHVHVGETKYHDEFLRRVREAREAVGYTQVEIADLLGIPQDHYKQYETRSMMPHELIPRFCLAARVSLDWLMTGRSAQAGRPFHPRRRKSE